MSFQKLIALGNLGKDPDIRQLQDGTSVCSMSVAVTEKWGNEENQKHTEWLRVIVFDKQAELCGKYLSKGKRVLVEGTLRTRKYEKDGEERSITEVRATRVRFIDPVGGEEERSAKRKPEPKQVEIDEDIPF